MFSVIFSGCLNNIDNLSEVSVAISPWAEVQKVEIGYIYSRIVTKAKEVALKSD